MGGRRLQGREVQGGAGGARSFFLCSICGEDRNGGAGAVPSGCRVRPVTVAALDTGKLQAEEQAQYGGEPRPKRGLWSGLGLLVHAWAHPYFGEGDASKGLE